MKVEEKYMQLLRVFTICLFLIIYCNTIIAAGLSFDNHHRVIATTQETSDFTLSQLQQSINHYQLKIPLIVSVEISPNEYEVLVWCKDKPERKFHRVWIVVASQSEIRELLEYAVKNIKLYERMKP